MAYFFICKKNILCPNLYGKAKIKCNRGLYLYIYNTGVFKPIKQAVGESLLNINI